MKKFEATVREMNMRGTPAPYDADFNPISQDAILKGEDK